MGEFNGTSGQGRDNNAHGLDELLAAKMATTSKKPGGVIAMVLTYKAINWAVKSVPPG